MDRAETDKMSEILTRLLTSVGALFPEGLTEDDTMKEWLRIQNDSFRKPIPDDKEVAEAQEIVNLKVANQNLQYEFLTKAFILSACGFWVFDFGDYFGELELIFDFIIKINFIEFNLI